MDIHQIMQALGQILYLSIVSIGDWIRELSGYIGMMMSGIQLPSAPTVIKVFSNTSVNRIVFYIAVGYIAIINITAFCLYRADKKSARNRKRRISERKLINICVMGGAGGGLLGMLLCRHKTQHKKFNVTVPVLFAIQLIIYSFVIGFLGFWAFF